MALIFLLNIGEVRSAHGFTTEPMSLPLPRHGKVVLRNPYIILNGVSKLKKLLIRVSICLYTYEDRSRVSASEWLR